DHNHVNTRKELIEYDPAIAELCAKVFGDNDWVYQKPTHPDRKNDFHLKNLDRSKLKSFEWSEDETKAYNALPRNK
ncbi:hypothetical protein OAE38_01015, partial [Akkermansiaceae bacterium]|nr:hypothetical protein [Akkermansiaceae bacterium]